MKRIIMAICNSMLIIPLLCAQTFHFISMTDTNDKNIGKGVNTDRMKILNEMETIAGFLEEYGYDSRFCDYYGVNCGKATLMQAINDLQVDANDVVMFYYNGHGARAFNDTDPFPQMCLGTSNEQLWTPATLIKNMLLKKNPRLTLVFTDCCNKAAQGVTIKSVIAKSGGYTDTKDVKKDVYKKLFLDSKGYVQATSSKDGEYSYCTANGSFFTVALLDVLKEAGEGSVAADWNTICSNAQNSTTKLDSRQHPYYVVSATNEINSVQQRDNTTNIRISNNTSYDLSKSLEPLLDKSRDVNSRLAMIPNILANHFTTDAKVLTIGRDMTTVVDYEDASVFLRRITMSPYITQINVVEQSGGKNKQVTVHEVRNR